MLGGARARRAQRRRLGRRIDQVVALAGGAPAPRIAVHPAAEAGLAEALRERLPKAQVVPVPRDPAARLVLRTEGQLDVIVDQADPDGRRARFVDSFFLLRPGGGYLVPDGADELGADPGPLGTLLRTAADDPTAEMSRWRKPRDQAKAVLRDHVVGRADGPDLVLSHDLDGVRLKLREHDLATYVAATPTHCILDTIPAAAPEPPLAQVGPEGGARFDDLPISAVELTLREYRDVVVGPQQLVITDDVVLPDTFRHNQWDRLASRALVSVSRDYARPLHALPADLPLLSGTYVHLDNEVRGHFGHLLTESVGRMWSWERALAIDPDARALVGATPGRPELLPYEVAVYEACGVPRDRLVKLDGPVRVERLISGTPLFSNPHYVHPLIAETWQRAGDHLAAQATRSDWPRRIFVSRRISKRSCVNGPELEQVFIDHGFDIVFPEDLSLGDQVAMFRAAEVVAGYAGSGVFQLEFVPEPKHVILVGSESYRPRNELLISAVRRHRLDRLVCRSDGKLVQSSFRYDEQRDGPFLRGLLAEIGEAPARGL